MKRTRDFCGLAGTLFLSVLTISMVASTFERPSRAEASDQRPKIQIRGTCVDRGGTPIENAEVSLYRSSGPINDPERVKTVKTDSSGSFDLGEWADLEAELRVESGQYLGIARKTGHASTSFQTLPDLKGIVQVKVAMAPAVSIRGQVVDALGKPVSGARVYASPDDLKGFRSCTTDEEGRYEITDMPEIRAEYYEINKIRKPKSRLPLSVSHPTLGIKTTWYSETPAEIDIDLDEPAVVAGTVIDAHGKPAPGVVVCLQSTTAQKDDTSPPLGLMRKTDSNGRYEFRVQPQGTANLFVIDDRYTAKAIEFLKLEDVESVPDLKLSAGGLVVGRMIDDATGKPLKLEPGDRMFVHAHSQSRPLSSAAVEAAIVQQDGSYQLRVPAGFCRAYFGGHLSRRNIHLEVVAGPTAQTAGQKELSVKEGSRQVLDFKVRIRSH